MSESSAALRDGWRLTVGTLTVLHVAPPQRVDTGTARIAMVLAPVAVVPLAVTVAAVGTLGHAISLPTTVSALLAVGLLALGTRCLHLDGLSDTIDGLAASYDCERSLRAMKSGTAGPAGVVGLILVIGLQVACLATLFADLRGAVLAGVAVATSRAALTLCCLRGIPSARPDGLGASYASLVSPAAAAGVWVFCAIALTASAIFAGLAPWRGSLAIVVAAVAVGLLLRRTHQRLSGVTGDVYGATVECALAATLVVLV